ncbi:hypothetical protein HKBW3S06_01406 [Candidatus Hakubella thermalkaliphila]|uniref:Uncharacterized protein n=1 Tax=Candidatus Hakubella thermalkaliphila TaxID=2754717 RepID=A0A6V8NP47_9ACTN|nr:hypothetical protein [Candidatus Hakubella thermalkaliphila]GFP22179.1 hypothetical protein HKBW3S06_01406 [Candidatus Hakubella thermalkaliphila]
MSTLMFPKGTVQALRDLTGESRPDAALLLVLRDAVTYRLEQIEAELDAFGAKYGMSFDEYRRLWESEDRDEHYRWEAERDYLEWEALVTRKRRLEDVYGWLT